MLFGGLFPRPPPDGMPGFLLGALLGTGVLDGALGGVLFGAIAISLHASDRLAFGPRGRSLSNAIAALEYRPLLYLIYLERS